MSAEEPNDEYHAWLSQEFVWTPFPRDPITEEQFDALGELVGEWAETEDVSPGVATRNGILHLSLSGAQRMPDDQWAALCVTWLRTLGIEGSGQVITEYNVMRHHD